MGLCVLTLRWHGRHSAEVNEKHKPGLQSRPGLLLVSGLGLALGNLALPNFKKGFSRSLIYS